MPCCKAEKYGWCKDEVIADYKDEMGNEYCIFHAPDGEKGTLLEPFSKMVFDKLEKARANSEVCNLSGIIFEDIDFNHFRESNPLPETIFKDAQFRGKAIFDLTHFQGLTDFSTVQFNGYTSFAYAYFNGRVLFSNAKFRDATHFIFTKFKENADFLMAEFSDEANFLEAQFHKNGSFLRAKFNKHAEFFAAQFNDIAYFGSAEFRETAIFDYVKINKDAYFGGTIFRTDASFKSTVFSGKANFIDIERHNLAGTQFGGDVNFHLAKFVNSARFGRNKFLGKASFSEVEFRGRVDFHDSIFKKEANFSHSTFHEVTDFSGVEFNENVSISMARFNANVYFYGETFIKEGILTELNIKADIVFEKVNLSAVSFSNTDMRRTDFINCQWLKKYGRNMLYDEIELFRETRLIDDETGIENNEKISKRFKGNIYAILKREWKGFIGDVSVNKNWIKKIEILYRRLKHKYKDEHNESEVSNWHFGEKEMQRKGSLLSRYFPFSLSNLYWISSGYGERPLRAVMFLFLLILSLSLLMTSIGLVPLKGSSVFGIEKIEGLADLNYFTLNVVLLNTLQYATFQKEPYFKTLTLGGEYLKLMTRILIPLQVALFAFAVRNRFRR